MIWKDYNCLFHSRKLNKRNSKISSFLLHLYPYEWKKFAPSIGNDDFLAFRSMSKWPCRKSFQTFRGYWMLRSTDNGMLRHLMINIGLYILYFVGGFSTYCYPFEAYLIIARHTSLILLSKKSDNVLSDLWQYF